MRWLWIGTIANLIMYFIGDLPMNAIAAGIGALCILINIHLLDKIESQGEDND